jgi:acetolactate synthase-1/2/3 large subunit
MDSIPMVVISGQVQSHLIGEDAFQETDMVGISRPIVKHSFLVQRTEDIPSIIKKAFTSRLPVARAPWSSIFPKT